MTHHRRRPLLATALHYPLGLETFTATVVPILRECGLFREGYTGTTLREHLGLPRPVYA